ncbi:MAG: 2-hydroxyacid dehydrogenase [Trueperaceae bacterium]|nr:2-hydroxyacid dehydrogenase [Trueperaceae bacterium]
MKLAIFSTKPYDRRFFSEVNTNHKHQLSFFEARLSLETVSLAEGFEGVCAFVNDSLGAEVLEHLAKGGTRLIALRSAGFNHVDLEKAHALGLTVVRVPAYSPHAVAEHALALMLALNRKIHRAFNRVREANFALDGLMGFDVHGKTIGVIGTGKIGQSFIQLASGFGGKVIAYDPYPNDTLAVTYVSLEKLFQESAIISLHCPLTPETHHLINQASLAQMQDGVMLINTSRGALVDTGAVIEALKSGKIGHLGLDVYEEEGDLFFEDLSNKVIQDDVFTRLLTFPNVIITGHQGFFTQEALHNIAETTLTNVTAFEGGTGEYFEVKYEA